jgi:Domain of unknown function (DUF4386)
MLSHGHCGEVPQEVPDATQRLLLGCGYRLPPGESSPVGREPTTVRRTNNPPVNRRASGVVRRRGLHRPTPGTPRGPRAKEARAWTPIDGLRWLPGCFPPRPSSLRSQRLLSSNLFSTTKSATSPVASPTTASSSERSWSCSHHREHRHRSRAVADPEAAERNPRSRLGRGPYRRMQLHSRRHPRRAHDRDLGAGNFGRGCGRNQLRAPRPQGLDVVLGPGFVVGVGNGLLLGYLMYRSGLVPRPLAVLGLIGGPLICISEVAVMFGVFDQGGTGQGIATVPEFFGSSGSASGSPSRDSGRHRSSRTSIEPSPTSRLPLASSAALGPRVTECG